MHVELPLEQLVKRGGIQHAFAAACARENQLPQMPAKAPAASCRRQTSRPLLVTEADCANLSLLGAPRLRAWLACASRVPSDAMPADVVTMNSRVVCIDLSSGQRCVLSVVYPDDADANEGRFSVLTGAGLALLGTSPPQVIEWSRADDTLRRMRVEALAYQPEQDLRNKLIFRPGPAA